MRNAKGICAGLPCMIPNMSAETSMAHLGDHPFLSKCPSIAPRNKNSSKIGTTIAMLRTPKILWLIEINSS